MNATPIIPQTSDTRTAVAAAAVAELLAGFEVNYSRSLDTERATGSVLSIHGEHCTHYIEYRDGRLNIGFSDLPGVISPKVMERIAGESGRVARAAAFIEVRQQVGMPIEKLLELTALATRAECSVQACDKYGEPVPPTHVHEKPVGVIEFDSAYAGSTGIGLAFDEKRGEWMVDLEPIDDLITAFDSRQLVALLDEAAAEAERLNATTDQHVKREAGQ